MKQALWIAALLAAAAGGVASPSRSSTEPESTAAGAEKSEAEIRDLDIAFFAARVERDPHGALDRAKLGGLYLQRARETGSPDDLVRAERIARESFKVRARKNEVALHVLASSLLGQHRYQEALEAVAILVAEDSSQLSYRALKGEIELELGLYAQAEHSFAGLQAWSHKLTVAPRLAHWEELRGRPDKAREILLRARTFALNEVNLPREQKAWFHLRVGDLALRYGHLDKAEDALGAGLELSPDDYRLLSAMTRLEYTRHHWKKAIAFGERTIGLVLDPGTLGMLGDAHMARGDSAQAAEYYRTMELVIASQPGAFHRAWSLFLLDHNRKVDEVLVRVEEDIAVRKDVYGYDLLAWALYRNGRFAEAAAAMDQALALGTRDPQLHHHAAVIRRAAANAGR